MKKCLALLLVFALLLPAAALADEDVVIINKIKNPENPFTFPEDARLLEIYFPRIDDNDSAFLRYGDYTMLLDCAGAQWERVRSLLAGLNVTTLTYAYNTHPHTDHIGGFQHLLKEVKAENFIYAFPEDYTYNDKPAPKVYAELHSQEVPFRRVQHGDTIDFGEVEMTIFQRWNDAFTCNNNSSMLLVRYGERSFLFSSDIQRDAQLNYVAHADPLQADIMTFPHHGFNRMQRSFLSLVEPELVVITSGSMFAEGVPLLKEQNIPYHYTELGVMRFATDGKVWLVERFD